MLKKTAPIPAAFALAAFLSVPAPSALAWEEACVRFPLVPFTGHLAVAHDFDFARGMPDKIPARLKHGLPVMMSAPAHTVGGRGRAAETAVHSRLVVSGASRCVSIRHIPEGAGFAVYLHTSSLISGDRVAHCSTPKDNPDLWLRQQNNTPRQIYWRAAGFTNPACHFWREK